MLKGEGLDIGMGFQTEVQLAGLPAIHYFLSSPSNIISNL
jgi:hypothetical protein